MDRRNFIATGGAALASALPLASLARAPGESDAAYNERMAWWREARFGMFIHWGLYAIPAGVWKGKRIEAFPAEWIMFAKDIPKDEYAALAPRFNPDGFDAREWAAVAKRAGMKYMVITSKHHDGFCMYKSELTDYNIVDGTPFGRDPIAELAEACADLGIRFGLYYSQLDWRYCSRPYLLHFMPRFKKYLSYMKGQVEEILTKYGPICSLFFDGDWMPQWNEKVGREVESICRSLQPETIVNSRLGKRSMKENVSVLAGAAAPMHPPNVGDYATPEQQIPESAPGFDWETCMTMNDSWGYRSWDDNWKPADTLVRNLVDIVSKGGNYLLNVGPDAKGVIPAASVELLGGVGRWMDKNGESIYGAEAGPLQGLDWCRTTKKGDTVYLHVLDRPAGGVFVEGLSASRAYMLDGGAEVEVTRHGSGISLTLPAGRTSSLAETVALEGTGR